MKDEKRETAKRIYLSDIEGTKGRETEKRGERGFEVRVPEYSGVRMCMG